MNATTTAQPRSRSLRPAKEELPSLLEAHDPPISRNKLSQRVGINLAHVSRACSPRHRARFSGEALGRIALLLGLPRDYFPEYRLDYLIRRFGGDGELRDRIYDLLQVEDESWVVTGGQSAE